MGKNRRSPLLRVQRRFDGSDWTFKQEAESVLAVTKPIPELENEHPLIINTESTDSSSDGQESSSDNDVS